VLDKVLRAVSVAEMAWDKPVCRLAVKYLGGIEGALQWARENLGEEWEINSHDCDDPTCPGIHVLNRAWIEEQSNPLAQLMKALGGGVQVLRL
jgi:hypothetical protein